jgi:DNA-directed RNA polymerase specialized sigma24 family protein
VTHDEDIRALRRSLRDPAVFDVLFACHHSAVRRYLHARLGDAAVAEDLAAETFARAFAARARFRDQGHGVRAWLFTIATNLLCDELRVRARRARASEIAVVLGIRVGTATRTEYDMTDLDLDRVRAAYPALHEEEPPASTIARLQSLPGR